MKRQQRLAGETVARERRSDERAAAIGSVASKIVGIESVTITGSGRSATATIAGFVSTYGRPYRCHRCTRWFQRFTSGVSIGCTVYHFANECCHCHEREVAPDCDALGHPYEYPEPDPIPMETKP